MSQASFASGEDPGKLSAFMAPRKFWTSANIVIAVSTGLIALILAIFAGLCVQGFSTVLDQAKSKTAAAADVAAKENELLLGGARALLRHLAADAVIDPNQLNQNSISAAIKTLPEVVSFGLYDANGNAVGDLGSPNLPAAIRDLEFFTKLSTGGIDWTISKQLTDVSSNAPIFVVAQTLPGETFGGVALLVISGNVMKDFWGPLQLGPESTTSILTDDGWVVARYPTLPKTMNSSQAPAFTTLKGSESGTYISERSPADGVARVVGFRRLPELGVIAVTSVAQDAVYAPLWTSIITVLWLIIPIAMALLVGSIITASILNRSARTQASLAAALRHNEVLFREIHHRVKNNLQSVASLLQMQPIPADIKIAMGHRLAAMSAVHEHIYRSNDFSTVRIKTYIETLIENIRGGTAGRVTVVEHLEDLRVDKDAATPLGLILNEVVANALKHAFPDGRDGVISVQLAQATEGRARLTVTDNGVGYDPERPAKGIGQRLIRALSQQLGGVVEQTSSESGSAFILTFPLVHDDEP